MANNVAIICLLLWVNSAVSESDVCDAASENCLTDTDVHKYGIEANHATEEVKEGDIGQTEVEEEEAVTKHDEKDEAVKPGTPVDNKYTNMFDENGNFNRELAKDIISEDEYQDVEEASLPEGRELVENISTPNNKNQIHYGWVTKDLSQIMSVAKGPKDQRRRILESASLKRGGRVSIPPKVG